MTPSFFGEKDTLIHTVREFFSSRTTTSVRMPRNARCVEPGLAYHVTQRGSNRQRVFFAASDYRMYLNLVREQLEDAGARV